MTGFLLSVHVLAAILTIGPVAIAASMFPRAVRAAADTRDNAGVAPVLHRITRVYAVVGVAVPVFGVATGASLGVLTDAWLIVSMTLTAAAAAVLLALILPGQRAAITAVERASPVDRTSRRLAMHTGMFNLLWAVVVVLMIYRPGSTTGAGA
ncbi:hypothetical protein BJF85_21250 [Saccharomonospora sp. CUA-673]|uniref:DUF2269 family protein n=1 Tax=Saccharomonospora sp. CUA-673 TaxID=1904969 RepID=UPI0009596947|nr:hypothetical protein [Saccharomonospora sp. CUA-673]OLT43755.1 hypothetical protein BJF85_21250 [Saccharomonospora sp. CUA-673]